MEDTYNMQSRLQEDVDYTPVFGLSHTGRQTIGAACAHVGVQSST